MSKKIRRIKLQAALEMATNYALETGDTSVYEWDSYKQAKGELCGLIRNSTPPATNYGGGAPDGGH